MVHIAITGATGFVGSHVLESLLDYSQSEIRVTAMVRDPSSWTIQNDRLNVVRGDIHQFSADAYDQLGRPDVLMHLAWAGLPNYEKNFHFEHELPLQYAFLKNVILGGLPKLLVSGTCFEYGSLNGPLSVDMSCAEPSTAYAFAKKTLHQQLLFLQKEHPFVLKWARLFYMYGDRQRHGSLYSSLKKAAENGDSFFSMSSGEQIRDYLSVQEVASQLTRYALSEDIACVKNVCSGNPISIRKIAQQWCLQNAWEIDLRLGDKLMPSHEPLAFWGVQ